MIPNNEDPIHPLYNRIDERFGKYLPPKGWWDLCIALDKELALIDPNYMIHQCKEKFGGLRYYVALSEDLSPADHKRCQKLIQKAEEKSYEICETCGEVGKIRGELAWHRTLCDKHLLEFSQQGKLESYSFEE